MCVRRIRIKNLLIGTKARSSGSFLLPLLTTTAHKAFATVLLLARFCPTTFYRCIFAQTYFAHTKTYAEALRSPALCRQALGVRERCGIHIFAEPIGSLTPERQRKKKGGTTNHPHRTERLLFYVVSYDPRYVPLVRRSELAIEVVDKLADCGAAAEEEDDEDNTVDEAEGDHAALTGAEEDDDEHEEE
jgi:hypothetical protein